MDITAQRTADTLTITVAGQVDPDNAYRLCDAVAEATGTTPTPAQIIVDVSSASFSDFAVTGLLRRLSEQTVTVGASFVLHGASAELAATVASSGLGVDIHLS